MTFHICCGETGNVRTSFNPSPLNQQNKKKNKKIIFLKKERCCHPFSSRWALSHMIIASHSVGAAYVIIFTTFFSMCRMFDRFQGAYYLRSEAHSGNGRMAERERITNNDTSKKNNRPFFPFAYGYHSEHTRKKNDNPLFRQLFVYCFVRFIIHIPSFYPSN